MRNMYEVDEYTYEQLFNENITKTYKKSNLAACNEINEQAKNIATELRIADRVQSPSVHYTERPQSRFQHKPQVSPNQPCQK